jgi:UDP-2-acetamido-3-amino-2,3-dideoxy-glucuronate N-acetyltransferase
VTSEDMEAIHPTAVVEEGAFVGSGTRVWHHAHIRAGAVLGRGCTVGKNVFIDAEVTIGSGVKLENNVSVYRGVSLEDDVFVGPNTVFTNDRFPRANNERWNLVKTIVRRGASVGAGSTIVCGLEIGTWAMIGAGAVVTHSVLPHELVVGNPARHAGWICACGKPVIRGSESSGRIECGACASRPR